jgi:hypothetical protein
MSLTNAIDSFEQVEVIRLSNLVFYRDIICDIKECPRESQ